MPISALKRHADVPPPPTSRPSSRGVCVCVYVAPVVIFSRIDSEPVYNRATLMTQPARLKPILRAFNLLLIYVIGLRLEYPPLNVMVEGAHCSLSFINAIPAAAVLK